MTILGSLLFAIFGYMFVGLVTWYVYAEEIRERAVVKNDLYLLGSCMLFWPLDLFAWKKE